MCFVSPDRRSLPVCPCSISLSMFLVSVLPTLWFRLNVQASALCFNDAGNCVELALAPMWTQNVPRTKGCCQKGRQTHSWRKPLMKKNGIHIKRQMEMVPSIQGLMRVGLGMVGVWRASPLWLFFFFFQTLYAVSGRVALRCSSRRHSSWELSSWDPCVGTGQELWELAGGCLVQGGDSSRDGLMKPCMLTRIHNIRDA